MSKHTVFLCLLSLLSLAPGVYDPHHEALPVATTQLVLPAACPVTLYSDAMLQTAAWPRG